MTICRYQGLVNCIVNRIIAQDYGGKQGEQRRSMEFADRI